MCANLRNGTITDRVGGSVGLLLATDDWALPTDLRMVSVHDGFWLALPGVASSDGMLLGCMAENMD